MLGADVKPAEAREYGRTRLDVTAGDDPLLRDLPAETTVWMSHGDQVKDLPSDFIPLAKTPTCPYAACKHKTMPFYGVQFHPEVTHTPRGETVFRNFLYGVCGCAGKWGMGDFAAAAIEKVRDQVGGGKIICGLSGGVDSSVTAALLHKAVGDQLVCIFVDNGLLRKNERGLVERTFRDHFRVDLRVIDATDAFLDPLRGVRDPQEKRKIIGREFIEVFKREAATVDDAKVFGTGNSLSRRDRERPRPRRHGCQHQAPPQRRRPAGAARLRACGTACASCSRTRCARSARCWACRKASSGGTRSPAPVWPSE